MEFFEKIRKRADGGKVCLPTRTLVLGLALLTPVAGCHSGGAGAGSGGTKQEKTFNLRGKIVSEDAVAGSITVNAGAIPGFMEAMTMPYKLVQPNIMSELHVGDLITADVIVDYDAAGPMSPKLDHLVVVGQARPDTKPTVE